MLLVVVGPLNRRIGKLQAEAEKAADARLGSTEERASQLADAARQLADDLVKAREDLAKTRSYANHLGAAVNQLDREVQEAPDKANRALADALHDMARKGWGG